MHNSLLRQLFTLLLLAVLPTLTLQGQTLEADAAGTPALLRSNAYTADMEAYQVQLADLESRYGPYHRSLLEPLQGMTALAKDVADLELVAELQNRQLQVMRTVFGFRNPELEPLIRDIITNAIARAQWSEVADHLEHLRYLATDDSTDLDTRLRLVEQQADWELMRVFLEDADQRARNFMRARSFTDELLSMAEQHYGESAPELIPWLYKSALTNYRLVEMLNADTGISSDIVDRLVQEDGTTRLISNSAGVISPEALFGSNSFVPIVDEGELVGEAYLRDGMRAVERIGGIAESQRNLEAQAMALIYEGDFQRILGNGLAFRKYRDARDLLLEAGVPEARVEAYFNVPMLIPAQRLHLTLEEALADRETQHNLVGEAAAGKLTLGPLLAWDEGVPNVPRPVSADATFALDLPHDQVDLTLSISQSGRISSVEVQAAEPPERRVERKAWRAVRDIKVRPALVAGKAQRSRDVHIQFLSLPE